MATLFDSAHGYCSHAADDKDLAFISHMGIEIWGVTEHAGACVWRSTMLVAAVQSTGVTNALVN
jgi:hypothetical protein